MVSRADAVVLDATDWSEAMDTELAIVDACGASDRLIILGRHGYTAENAVQARQLLRYRVSWRQAGHRIFWSFMLTVVPAIIGESVGWPLKIRALATLPAVLAWLFLAVRPLMDEGATDELERRLTGLRNNRSPVASAHS
jgi:hypothetical protein